MSSKPDCKAVVAVCFLVAIVTVSCQPVDVQSHNANPQDNKMSQRPMRTSMSLIGDATSFLRNWFQRLRARLDSNVHSSGHFQESQPRAKRSPGTEVMYADKPDTRVNESNDTSFETYEKKFLINQTLNYLKQIYYYSEYRQKMRENNTQNTHTQGSTVPSVPVPIETPNNTNRVNSLLSAKMSELSSLSLSQLEKIFHSVRRAAANGVEDPGITSVCCPQG